MKQYIKENLKSDLIGFFSLFLLFPFFPLFLFIWRKKYSSFIIYAGRLGFWFYGFNGIKFLPCLDILFTNKK